MSVVKDFVRGLKILAGGGTKGGDKKLARLALFTKGMIPAYGADVVRKQLIKGIEGDIDRCLKKTNPKDEIDKMIANAMNTPDYVSLLKELNLNEDHLHYLADEGMKKHRIAEASHGKQI